MGVFYPQREWHSPYTRSWQIEGANFRGEGKYKKIKNNKKIKINEDVTPHGMTSDVSVSRKGIKPNKIQETSNGN